MKKKSSKVLLGVAALVAGIYLILKKRRTIPKGVKAVRPLDVKKYMGKWYEIARIDHLYEKGLNKTTAEYAVDKDGSILVTNRGYNPRNGKFVEAHGKAVFADSPEEGKLKVSFFGPFSAGYNVIQIDKDYHNALIAGEDFDHLWLLSRNPIMSNEVKKSLLDTAVSYGYDVSRLNWVMHH